MERYMFVFFSYLDAINDTPVTYVEGMHHKHEDDGLKHGLAHVLEGESHEEELSYDEGYHFRRSQLHHQHDYHDYDHTDYGTGYLVKLLHCCLSIV